MANPLSGGFTGMGTTPTQQSGLSPQMLNGIQSVKQMMNTMRSMQNPYMAMQQMAQTNPQITQVIQMCNGQNPQTVFMNMCKQRGIDPQMFLNELQR